MPLNTEHDNNDSYYCTQSFLRQFVKSPPKQLLRFKFNIEFSDQSSKKQKKNMQQFLL